MADESHPLITIGMTCYNAADTIGRALDSAFAQTWSAVEILIVDDCSADASSAIVAEKTAGRDNVRVIRHAQNKGFAGALNTIVANARGAYIAIFDDDDQSVPERLVRQHARLSAYERDFAHGQLVICHAARLQVYPDGGENYAPTMGMTEGRAAPQGEAVVRRILFNDGPEESRGALATCSQMARPDVYRRVGGFDETFRRAEDTDFTLRLAAAGTHFVGIAEPLVHQTMTLGADKRLTTDRLYAERLFDKHAALLGARAPFQRRWLALKYDFLMRAWRPFGFGLLRLAIGHPLLTARQIARALPNLSHNRRRQRQHGPDARTGAA